MNPTLTNHTREHGYVLLQPDMGFLTYDGSFSPCIDDACHFLDDSDIGGVQASWRADNVRLERWKAKGLHGSLCDQMSRELLRTLDREFELSKGFSLTEDLEWPVEIREEMKDLSIKLRELKLHLECNQPLKDYLGTYAESFRFRNGIALTLEDATNELLRGYPIEEFNMDAPYSNARAWMDRRKAS